MIMITITVVGIGIALATLVWHLERRTRVVLRTLVNLERPQSAPPEVQDYDDAWIVTALQELTQAVSEGIQHVDRSERRVRAVVASAKRRMESEGYTDPGLEAEASALPLFDAEGVQREGVQPVPTDVDAPASYEGTPWAAVPGIERV